MMDPESYDLLSVRYHEVAEQVVVRSEDHRLMADIERRLQRMREVRAGSPVESRVLGAGSDVTFGSAGDKGIVERCHSRGELLLGLRIVGTGTATQLCGRPC